MGTILIFTTKYIVELSLRVVAFHKRVVKKHFDLDHFNHVAWQLFHQDLKSRFKERLLILVLIDGLSSLAPLDESTEENI